MSRPREFEETEVVDKAMRVFWRQGYEGTSLDDLMNVTGLTKSSIYKAFGNKANLYRLAKERYDTHYLEFQRKALEEETPRKIAEKFLYTTARLHTSSDTPKGCFETNGALACSEASEEIRLELIKGRVEQRARLRKRFDATRSKGPVIGGSSDAAALFVVTLVQGMAVQAKAGASRQELERFIDMALEAWPKK